MSSLGAMGKATTLPCHTQAHSLDEITQRIREAIECSLLTLALTFGLALHAPLLATEYSIGR